MAEERVSASDLGPAEIREIAGRAGGLTVECVEGYLDRTRRTHVEKAQAIERALREMGLTHFIRKPGVAKAR